MAPSRYSADDGVVRRLDLQAHVLAGDALDHARQRRRVGYVAGIGEDRCRQAGRLAAIALVGGVEVVEQLRMGGEHVAVEDARDLPAMGAERRNGGGDEGAMMVGQHEGKPSLVPPAGRKQALSRVEERRAGT